MEIQFLSSIFWRVSRALVDLLQETAGDEIPEGKLYALLVPQKLFTNTQPVPSVLYKCQDLGAQSIKATCHNA